MDDHDLGARLKVLLDPPPPGLDAVRATSTARRAHRRRRRYTAGAAVVLLAATGAVAGFLANATGRDPARPAPPADYDRCVVRQGAVPRGVRVTAADPSGTYLAGFTIGDPPLDPADPPDPPQPTGPPPDVRLRAVVVRDGAVTPIPEPVAGATTYPAAMDRSGTVFGWSETGGDAVDRVPWEYRAGVTTRLPIPAGYVGAVVDAVNARGDVAGSAFRWGAGLEQVGVVWPAGAFDSPVVTTPGPEHTDIDVAGIADDGTLVARAVRSPDGVRSYAWRPGGAVRQLEGPAGWSVWVTGANGPWAVGHVRGKGGAFAPARWDLTTGAVRTYPDVPHDPAAVSADGVLVLNDTEKGGVVVVDAAGRAHRLPTPSARAVAISDDGRTIVGSAVWTC